MSKFSQDIEKVLLPLKGFLDFDLIKTEDELMLTYAIMRKDYLIQNLEDSKNKREEPVQFQRAKDNMIKWLETLKTRDDIFKASDYDALITELENIKHIERATTNSTANKKKLQSWVPMYRTLEVGIDRALEIAKAIEKWVLYINPILHSKTSHKDIKNLNSTIKSIDKDFHKVSIELYNRLECFEHDFQILSSKN